MIDKKLVAGKAYSLPTVDIERFDIEDVIRTSVEVAATEVDKNYADLNWDSQLTGGLN